VHGSGHCEGQQQSIAPGGERLRAELSLALDGGSTAPVKARAALRALAADIAAEQFELLELLISELVTNSFVHGGAGPADRITMQITVYAHTVHGEVSDEGPGFTLPDPARPRETGGLGLVIVDRCASRWGTGDGGRRVWFELHRADPSALLREDPS
jgi:anti-sigma regulatory factor (Ser/Thr protein kinase)